MIKKGLVYILLIAISLVLFTFTARGNVGIPTVQDIIAQNGKSGKAFETSQEGARYGLLLSIYHDRSFNLDKYPQVSTPDLGKINGHYFSFFPPTLSILAIPLYLLGLQIGAPQITVFSITAIFSILTMCLIIKFSKKLGVSDSSALFAALAFGFGTNAWGYSVTLYAHVVSAFLLLLALYIIFFWEKKYILLKAFCVWLVYGLAVLLDYPNLITFFPIAILISLQGLKIEKEKTMISISYNWRFVIAPIIFLLILVFYGYYNYLNFGSPLQMSNTLPRVPDVNLEGIKKEIEENKSKIPALSTRNLLEGLRSFLISHDRSLLVFSPVVFLFIFGFNYLKEKRKLIEASLFGIAALNLIQYSMFGDPYGGWAFGSRYMIAVLPLLCILAGLGLQKFGRNILVKLIYSVVFIYSAGVSLFAPLTTNVIPPYVEARYLGLDSSYMLNWKMLQTNHLNSFVYNHLLDGQINGTYYYFVILGFISLCGLAAIWWKKGATK